MQDAQLCDIAGLEQVWFREGWVDRFDLDLPRDSHGYGHSPEEVAKVRASAELLGGYYHAVHRESLAYVASVSADELSRDRRRAVEPAGDRERAAGQHHRRRRSAPGPGGLRPGHRTLT